MISNRICILGTGAWATALGSMLSKNNNTIFMWGINQKEINDINTGYNKQYFGNKKFQSSLSATNDLRTAIGNSKYIILAVPSGAITEVIEKLKASISNKTRYVLINVVKGLDEQTHKPLSTVIRKQLKGYKIKLVTICGPSYAEEVFDEKPTIINITSRSLKLSQDIANIFNNKSFKLVPTTDEKGLQIYAALKNLLAIGIGLANEHFDSTNTISAMLTMGINEMKMIGMKMGAKRKTILNFCGIGDIFLTCSSSQSRNFSFGKSIYENGLKQTLDSNRKTVEGYAVFRVVEKIIVEKELNTPLFTSIIKMLKGEVEPKQLVSTIWELASQIEEKRHE